MADTKISALTAVTTPAATDEFPVNQGGTSKKVTLAQVRQSVGTTPTIVSVGTETTGTGNISPALPGTHATDDILVLCVQSSNEQAAAPAGYTQLGPRNGIGVAASAGSTRLSLFWKRDGGSESAPTVLDAGDHTYAVIFAVRGCATNGDPFRMIGQAWKFTASTTGTADAGTSRTHNSLIVSIFAHALDQAGAAGSSPTNASLTSVSEHFDDATTDGTGGGLYVMSGIMAAPGDIAASTVTWSGSTVDVSTTVAFVPADAFPMGRGPEVQTFIGSPPDLDDTWVKPSGARKVFAQIIDGGSGGSGGNTTTTAAGGGGGGGGGYDEAWYEAEELGSTVTVHAGKGGAAGTALLQAGATAAVSEFDKGNRGPLTSAVRIIGTLASAAASADGGNGGGGAGRGTTAVGVQTTRLDQWAISATRPGPGQGAAGGSGTTAPTGGGNADWGGGGGESGGDTDAAITAANNGWSVRGGGGGSGGRTNTTISQPGHGGGATSTFAAQGAAGAASTRLPYGGAGGVGGGSSVVTGGTGGFPGGGGGGGAGVAGGFGGAGGHGCVVVTTLF